MSENSHISLLREVHDDVAAHAAGLSADQLVQQSACADWDVAQVLGHLGSGAEIMTATLEALAEGRDAPGRDLNESVWARWNAMAPEAKRAGFLEHGGAVVAHFESIDPTLPVALPFMPAPVPVDQLAGFRVMEQALHAWDVRVPFDPDAQLFPPAVPVVLELVLGLMQRITPAGKIEGAPVLAVELVDPARSFGLLLGERVERVDRPADPDAVVRGTTENWLLLVAGRLGDRSLDVTGSVDLDDLRRVFSGF